MNSNPYFEFLFYTIMKGRPHIQSWNRTIASSASDSPFSPKYVIKIPMVDITNLKIPCMRF